MDFFKYFNLLLIVANIFTLVFGHDKNKENNLFDEGRITSLDLEKFDPDTPLLLKSYKESYITRNAAKNFLNKMKNYRDTHTSLEFKKLLDDFAFNPIDSVIEGESTDNIKSTGETFYGKKYFDYLPTDEVKSSKEKLKNNNALVEDLFSPISYVQTRPELQRQRENHRRFKRNLVPMYPSYYIPQPNRYYLPVPPPVEPQKPSVVLGNRNNFDLSTGLIFDYQYDPIRSGIGFTSINSVSNDQFALRPSSSWTTNKPPVTLRPPSRNPIPNSIYFPTQPPSYATTTTGTSGNTKKGTTTEAPSLFHSSDYDDDLDLTNRFGLDTSEPHRCTWAIVNCCGGQNREKRDRCFNIFACGKLLQKQPDSCNLEKIRQAEYERNSFLNSNRKK
uniref:CSON002949 protein n=1 Tax=Culicoides sonorensis TaxID=179676 RepID=A0A336JYG2_CULSO